MGGYSELVKNFAKTRDYVRDFFIYGCKVRSDFARKSARTYDDERRRVESWLSGYVRYEDSLRGRQIYLTVDSGHISENPLYQAYYAKSFTDNDIRLHFLLLDLLCDGEAQTVSELTKALLRQYNAPFEEQTVRVKLREYVREGILSAEKRGRATCYRLSPDTVETLLEQFPGLDDAIRFFSEVQPFGVVGNSLLKSAGLHNDVFLQKHNYIVRTLEDECLVTILEAMEEQRSLTFLVYSSRQLMSGEGPGRESGCIPLRVLTSVQTGRRYLIGFVPEYGKFNAFRMDFIRDLHKGDVCTEYPAYRAQLEQLQPRLFGVSFEAGKYAAQPEPLRVTLRVGQDEGYILDRIRRELRCGTFERRSAEVYAITISALDPGEVIPWLRTFTGRILSLEGGTPELRSKFRKDLRKMYDMYKEV